MSVFVILTRELAIFLKLSSKSPLISIPPVEAPRPLLNIPRMLRVSEAVAIAEPRGRNTVSLPASPTV